MTVMALKTTGITNEQKELEALSQYHSLIVCDVGFFFLNLDIIVCSTVLDKINHNLICAFDFLVLWTNICYYKRGKDFI